MSGLTPVRVAIVGTGGIAGIQLDNLVRMGGEVDVVGVMDVNAQAAQAFADKWGVPNVAATLAELIALSPDVVHLCTPPGVHAPQAIELLEANINVLCEKPAALSLAEFDTIRDAESRSEASFAVVSQHRFGGRAQWVAERLDGGGEAHASLGATQTAVCHTLWYRPDAYFEVPWRGTWASEGGGPTMGHGIHQIDTALALLGPWTEVVAVATRRARDVETEDMSHAIVTFESGAVMSIVNSLLSPREVSYLRVDTEHATIELEHLYGYGDDSWTLTPSPSAPESLAADWEASATGRGSGHGAQFAAVYAALRAGESLPVTTADARATLELIAAIYCSSFERRPVARGEIDAESPFYGTMRGSGAPWEDQ